MHVCACVKFHVSTKVGVVNTCCKGAGMYSVYRLLKALVFDDEATDSKETPHVKPGPGKEQELPKEPQKRYFTGEVTSLFENSGMIDQQVSCAAG